MSQEMQKIPRLGNNAPGDNPLSDESQPVGVQPQYKDQWMTTPVGTPTSCPPGLEYLTTIDQLLIRQKVELLEALTCFETNNKYNIKNSMGQKIYYAAEDTNCCVRCCCGPTRPFNMKILDSAENEVIHLRRPLACSSWCCPCCLQSLDVFAPVGTLVGRVTQNWSFCVPSFNVENADGDTVLRVEGRRCQWGCCRNIEFPVLSPDRQVKLGEISKQWAGRAKEMFTDADNFDISFPMDLDVNIKATLLGACFLIDFMYFDK